MWAHQPVQTAYYSSGFHYAFRMRHHNLQGETLRKSEVIVKFCVSVYFKQYFEVKVKQNILYGLEHIVHSLDPLRKQTAEVKDIITPGIQRGSYHAHSESEARSWRNALGDNHLAKKWQGIRQFVPTTSHSCVHQT